MSSDYCINIFEEDKLVNTAVSEFIGDVLNTFEQKVDDIFLATLDVPYATEMAMQKVQKLIELAMLGHDGKALSEEEQLEVFIPDGEPAPSTIDSWARGTVTVKKIAVEEHHHGIPHAFHSDTPSIASSYTGKSSATGRASSRGTARSNVSGHMGNNLDTTGKIIELEEEGDEFAGLGATGYMFDMLQKSKRKKENGYIEKDQDQGEFTLLQEQMEQAKKELRGKKFILDRYGKPVIIGNINADKLAPFSTPLGLNIRNANTTTTNNNNEQDNDNISINSQQQQQQNNKMKKKQFIRVAGSRSIDDQSFKPTLSLAVTLSTIESIPKLNPGISIRSNTTVRTGEKLPENPKRISKKQYMSQSLSRQSALRNNDNSTLDSIVSLSHTLDGNSSILSQPLGEKSMFSHASSNGQRSQYSNHSGNGGGSVTTMKNIDNLPDVDRYEGSRILQHQHSDHIKNEEESEYGPTDLNNSIQQGNIKKSKLANKPNDKQKANINLLAGSPENGRPKDRDLPKNMRPITERKHLPAPPLGYITGHGLSTGSNTSIHSNNNKSLMSSDSNW